MWRSYNFGFNRPKFRMQKFAVMPMYARLQVCARFPFKEMIDRIAYRCQEGSHSSVQNTAHAISASLMAFSTLLFELFSLNALTTC